MWITSMGNHGAAGVSQNAGVLVVLVLCNCIYKIISNHIFHLVTDAAYNVRDLVYLYHMLCCFNFNYLNWTCRSWTVCSILFNKCVSKVTIIESDDGLSRGQRQAIIWTNAEILLIRTLGTNLTEILSEIYTLSLNLKMSSAKWQRLFSASMC